MSNNNNSHEFNSGIPVSKSKKSIHKIHKIDDNKNNTNDNNDELMEKKEEEMKMREDMMKQLTQLMSSSEVPIPKKMAYYEEIPISKIPNFAEYYSGVPISKKNPPRIHPKDPEPSLLWSVFDLLKIPFSLSYLPIFAAPNNNKVHFEDSNLPVTDVNEYFSGIPQPKTFHYYSEPLPPKYDRIMRQRFTKMYPNHKLESYDTIMSSKYHHMNASFEILTKFGTSAPNVKHVQYPSHDTIISINDILARDKTALSTLRSCLEARGWCKIKYPEKTSKIIKSVMDNVHKWFTSTDLNEKLKYSRKLKNGEINQQSEYSYNRIPGFKEGLRILTGDIYNVHYKNNKYPDSVKDEILKINKEFDNLSIKLMKAIYDTIYNLNDYKQFGEIYDISILNEQDKNTLQYSMLDFVNYYNDKEYIENIRSNDDNKLDDDGDNNPKPNVLKSEFNVFAHSDPGLFALSFSSTNVGLEMYDHQSKEWIPIGLNEGIWWNGKTASIIDDKIKSGEHRVKIDNKTFKPRFTGWYEVSCNGQLKPEIMKETLDLMK